MTIISPHDSSSTSSCSSSSSSSSDENSTPTKTDKQTAADEFTHRFSPDLPVAFTRLRKGKKKRRTRYLNLEKTFLLSVLICGFVTISFIEYHYFYNNNRAVNPSSLSSLLSDTIIELPGTTHKNDAWRSSKISHSRCRQKSPSRPWAQSKNLPEYLKAYLDWHVEMRCVMEQNHLQQKYLVVQCLKEFSRCGGFADRFKSLPVYVFEAYKMNRILLIQWTKPFPLEEFLIAPPFGINWTVPEWLLVPSNTHITRYTQFGNTNNYQSQVVLTTRLQNPAVAYYNSRVFREFNERIYTYSRIYHDLFFSMFNLVPPLHSMLEGRMEQLALTPGEYTSVHVRARHPDSGFYNDSKTIDKSGGLIFQGRTKDKLVASIQKALNCASILAGNNSTPIYFTSDSHHATKYALHIFMPSTSHPIVGITHAVEPLHLDEPHFFSRKPSDYYATFLDMWVLSNSQ
mmetsp:Transcript_29434/g.42112  ORF Transcript_29434/g.42112 Transcript_29434/m.42112 type:complete len:457 (-) Transcript_29434:5026-6396(-)